MIGGATVRPRDAGRARCAFVLVAGARLGRQVGTDAYSCAPATSPNAQRARPASRGRTVAPPIITPPISRAPPRRPRPARPRPGPPSPH
ncbi:hypothetical protein CF645_32680 [Burkholderia pseudomallei]|nr:hypothetical protein CF645_32680 [Burkholderia pseudomallei]